MDAELKKIEWLDHLLSVGELLPLNLGTSKQCMNVGQMMIRQQINTCVIVSAQNHNQHLKAGGNLKNNTDNLPVQLITLIYGNFFRVQKLPVFLVMNSNFENERARGRNSLVSLTNTFFHRQKPKKSNPVSKILNVQHGFEQFPKYSVVYI